MPNQKIIDDPASGRVYGKGITCYAKTMNVGLTDVHSTCMIMFKNKKISSRTILKLNKERYVVTGFWSEDVILGLWSWVQSMQCILSAFKGCI